MIRRAFADVPHGQIHYRHAGPEMPNGSGSLPLLLLHASPGSSRQLVPLITSLLAGRRIIAPDTPGNGDSTPLEFVPTISDYARILPDFLDALGVDRVDLYGSHTGASIASELAVLAPGRIGKVIIEGVGLFTPEERDAHLTHYAHPFPPDLEGAYLMRAFTFCRDQYLFFPWYDRTPAGRRDGGLPPPETLHAWVVEVLKAAETYPLAYCAAFAWDARNRLPLVTQPSLVMAAHDDPLFDCTREAAPLLPQARFEMLPRFADSHFGTRRAALIANFLKD